MATQTGSSVGGRGTPSAARPRSEAKSAAATDRPRRPCSPRELGKDQPIEGKRRLTRRRESLQTMRTTGTRGIANQWHLPTERVEATNRVDFLRAHLDATANSESPSVGLSNNRELSADPRMDPELHAPRTSEDAVNETDDSNNRGFQCCACWS